MNFNSPLLWDVFAISTYFLVSLIFWYIGLIPDFATIRDRAKNKISKSIYGALSFGWDGVLRLGAGMKPSRMACRFGYSFGSLQSTPLYLWILQPRLFLVGTQQYFLLILLLGAIFRVCDGFDTDDSYPKVYKLEDYITIQHLEMMNIVIIITGSIVGVAYLTELFIAWYSSVEAEQYAFLNRATDLTGGLMLQ